MSLGYRILGLLVLITALAVVQVGIHLVRWSATAEERAELRDLRERVYDLGAEVIAMGARTDTLHTRLAEVDALLDRRRESIQRYDRCSRDGRLSPSLYEEYEWEAARFDDRMAGRTRLVRDLEETTLRYREARQNYHRAVVSMRALAAEIGDPYYPVPSPAEAAIERGLIPAP